MINFTIKQIAGMLGGTIEGDPNIEINNIGKIEEATSGSIAFLANPKYEQYLYTTSASCVLISRDFVAEKPITTNLLRVEDPYQAFTALLIEYEKLITKKKDPHTHPTAHIHPTATLGKDLYISAYVKIGEGVSIGDGVEIHEGVIIEENTSIGAGTVLKAGVKIMKYSVIGDACKIEPNAVIGADGFGFAPNSDGQYTKIPQIGNVVIENRVEIGANTTIDRATVGSTIIRTGVKLDNLIQIGHNVEVGEHTVIASQTGVAGSAKIGKRCMIGGQVGISGHNIIGDDVKIAAKSGLSGNFASGSILHGNPAYNSSDFVRSFVIFKRLPDFYREFQKLKKKLTQD